MKKIVVRLGVIALLGGAIAWIASNTYWGEVSIPQGLNGEAATNPFYSAQHLAESLGAHARWQRVLGSMPPRDGVVIASAWHWGLMKTRRERLEQWVAAGGRLVIDRTLIGGQRELQAWAGIARQVQTAPDGADADRKVKQEECPALDSMQTGPAGVRPRFALCGLDRISSLHADKRTTWSLRDAHHDIQALRVSVGLGSVTLINARPFGNLELLQGDHGRLFVAATQLRPADQVWFLTEEKGSSLLSLIWTTGAPVVVIVLALIALWLWRAGTRFGPPAAATNPARRSLAEQIRGTGQFTVRFGGGRALHGAAVRALMEAADHRIPGYVRLDGQQRIASIAELAGVDPGTLARAVSYSPTQHRIGLRMTALHIRELRQVLTQLEAVRRSIAS